MTKTDQKKAAIIRQGDVVKIIVPEFFIRCGYPKDIKEEAETVKKEFKNDLIKMMGLKDVLDWSHRSDSAKYLDKVCREIAYARLKMGGFGGKDRTIHTETIEDLKGKEFTVTGIKFCKTGVYFPPTGGYNSYDGDWDYDPGYLANEITHKILTLSSGIRVSELKIEAVNVEKIHRTGDDD